MPEIDNIFCCNCQSIVNLKLKFWGYNEKNMGFHLTPKSTVSSWALGDENAMGTYYFKLCVGLSLGIGELWENEKGMRNSQIYEKIFFLIMELTRKTHILIIKPWLLFLIIWRLIYLWLKKLWIIVMIMKWLVFDCLNHRVIFFLTTGSFQGTNQ